MKCRGSLDSTKIISTLSISNPPRGQLLT